MDISRFYPGALLDEPQKPAEKPPAEPQMQTQGSNGLNQNMLTSILPMLMGGGGDISSILGSLGGVGGANNDNPMISALTTMLKNKPQTERCEIKQKPPQQYQEADDYIFD
ncbi:MAG: hypothetical protein LBN07_03310 [Christensenellaceae bacterium]|jgi:hypothetical protein|nr:hypothetical protein [Christensenellaceae bacterium]